MSRLCQGRNREGKGRGGSEAGLEGSDAPAGSPVEGDDLTFIARQQGLLHPILVFPNPLPKPRLWTARGWEWEGSSLLGSDCRPETMHTRGFLQEEGPERGAHAARWSLGVCPQEQGAQGPTPTREPCPGVA